MCGNRHERGPPGISQRFFFFVSFGFLLGGGFFFCLGGGFFSFFSGGVEESYLSLTDTVASVNGRRTGFKEVPVARNRRFDYPP